jgi:hypothetical protein
MIQMTWFIAERILQSAIEAGTFDCSIEKGKPLRMQEDTFTNPADRLAFHLLKEAGMRPEWIELDLEIRNKLGHARDELLDALTIYGAEGDGWAKVLDQYKKRIEEINSLIRELNLKVPHPRFQRALLKPDQGVYQVRLPPQQI